MATTTKRDNAAVAAEFAAACRAAGWGFVVGDGSVVSIFKNFAAGSNAGLCECDSEYHGLLSRLPRSQAGSDWGTDCGGIGALSALKSGRFVMNRSGVNRLVMRELAKLAR